MCEFKEDYSHGVVVRVPDNILLIYNRPEQDRMEMVSVDRCMVDEIKKLWSEGIVTNGCCCGHNNKFIDGYIGVEPEYHEKMLSMGYKEMPVGPGGICPPPHHFYPISYNKKNEQSR